jgi:AmmeMemoRadiSam system protein B/AmmeMemoRadiSam system protein A
MSHLDRRFRFLRAAVAMLAMVAAALACAEATPPDEVVRSPCCAGSWYPGDAESLAKVVDGLLDDANPPKLTGKPLAVISPHAGYQFSAPVAAVGYRALRGHTYKRVIVLAFSHRYAGSYEGVDVPKDLTAYQTPLGAVPIDREACDQLLKQKMFSSHRNVGREEHSLELQLPFLQRVAPGFKLVPLLVGAMSVEDYTKAAEKILPLIDEETLLVASSDFTHYGPNYGYRPFREDIPKNLQALADQAFAPLEEADFDGFVEHIEQTKDTICGYGPILLMLRILSMKVGAVGVRAAVDTSGRMLGDWVNSVSYQSIVFVPRPSNLSHEERVTLLRLARQTLDARLNGKESIDLDPSALPAKLRAEGASFVTLKNKGELRGCIGNMVANGPLWQSVVRNSLAACQDYRFKYNPVTPKELPRIEVEVSYLTPLKKISSEEVVVGRDGLLISIGRRSGVLLPQVAYELGWTREEFLKQVCIKAGLPTNTWKGGEADLYTFQAEVFSEADEIHP